MKSFKDRKEEVDRELWENRHEFEKYYGYKDAKVTDMHANGYVTSKDHNGNPVEGHRFRATVTYTDMYGRPRRDYNVEYMVDKEGGLHQRIGTLIRGNVADVKYVKRRDNAFPTIKEKFGEGSRLNKQGLQGKKSVSSTATASKGNING